ncbi:hypothetical protein RCH06_003222 [Polaromonas sp. CG_9.5]|uniref:hypothetical protein n=1 Tax=Polaromonas sp. CG_9.5 TaxID=3071705 RepID=UPI002DFAE9A3|nr:hypothetical protein [Polaromonas sp. CG_9.5]
MKTPDSASPSRAVTRIKQRLLGGLPPAPQPRKAGLPALAQERRPGFPARIAEFLLVFRIRARRSAGSPGILAHAVNVVLVTCKHWFNASDSSQHAARRRE